MEEDIKNMSKKELLEYLEEISQQLDNIALDQIQFAISELQFFKEEYKKLEEENKKLKDNYKNQIEHTTILAKALNLEEDAPIDEIYAEINKLKTNSIPTSVIKEKIEWLKVIADNGMNAVRFACSKEDEIERMQKQKDINTMINILQEILEEGRK